MVIENDYLQDYPLLLSEVYKEITGLKPQTDYFYAVKALSGNYESELSNQIQVSTLSNENSGTFLNTNEKSIVYTADGQVYIYSRGEEFIQIYDYTGQIIFSGITLHGWNSFPVKSGILLLKKGDKNYKVVMK